MIDFIRENKEWLFGGLGISIISTVFFLWRAILHRRQGAASSRTEGKLNVRGNQTMTINNPKYEGPTLVVQQVGQQVGEEFSSLAENARQIAKQRIDDLVTVLLQKLNEHPDDSVGFGDPGTQMGLARISRGYARSGSVAHREHQLELLLSRARAEPRSLDMIILDEAIEVADRLVAERKSFTGIW